jgi:hypothetical protein
LTSFAGKSFISEVDSMLKSVLVEKLGQNVETELRLAAHAQVVVGTTNSNLAGVDETTNPFRIGVKEHGYFLQGQQQTMAYEPEKGWNFKAMVSHPHLS